MDTDQTMIVASRRDVPIFSLNTPALEAKSQALAQSALIGRVTDRDTKIVAVRAQQELKRVLNAFEKERKILKEPLLKAGRQLDTLIATESLELEKEFGRVTCAVTEFDNKERRRVLEEERLQRLELERIEREKQAELKRIADELAEKQKAADDVERARLEADAKAKAQAVEEQAGDAKYCAARPIEITAVKGQRTTTNWKITFENLFILAKHHPDLVDIKPRLADIKAALNEGREIKGIKAEKETVASVRVPAELKAIDV